MPPPAPPPPPPPRPPPRPPAPAPPPAPGPPAPAAPAPAAPAPAAAPPPGRGKQSKFKHQFGKKNEVIKRSNNNREGGGIFLKSYLLDNPEDCNDFFNHYINGQILELPIEQLREAQNPDFFLFTVCSV